eukprot:GGOE01054905.1.p1 GENE.GGOE01054905.1~~GGOE01054905.1.p1  ORF type:complete len:1000 (-),score=172.16 GGOE01054905.1:309-3308(-)
MVIFLLDHPKIIVDFENDGWRPIHIATEKGDLQILQLLLSRGADPNAPGQAGLTPLHLACLKGHAAVAEELVVMHNVDVNQFTVGNRTVDDGHETPLHLASMVGAFDCVDILLRNPKTTANARTAMGWTALHIASEHGHADVVELMLWFARWNAALGVDVNSSNCGWTPLHLACEEGHILIVLLLLLCGAADPNYKHFGGFAPLHLAAMHGHVEIVMALLSRHTLDRDIRTDGGSTALHIACEHHQTAVVEALLRGGADPDLATVTGDTALHTAADKGFSGLWHMLVKAGVNAHTPNHAGVTPSELAASKGHNMKKKKKGDQPIVYNSLIECVDRGDVDAVDRFLALNSDAAFLSAIDKDGRTALHAAAEAGNYQTFCRLLQLPNVNINAQTYTGNTALHIAAALGQRMMVKKLLGQQAINVRLLNHGWTPVSLHNMMPDSHVYAAFERRSGLQGVYVHDGREALHAACGAGHVLVTKMLLHHPNVNVNARSRGYLTPLHLAAERGDVEMVDMLLHFQRDLVDLNAADGNGATPLHDACRNGHMAVVNRFLAHPSVDINIMTTRYYGERCYYKSCGSGTPLHVACEYGHAGVVQLLLRHPDIDPSLPTPWGGATPLHVAAAVGLLRAVELLLTFDAVEINALQDDGCTAWDLAFKHGHRQVLDLLTPVNAHMPPDPDQIISRSALELQDLALQRFCRGPDTLSTAAGFPCVIRFQSSGQGYNPDEVSVMGDWNHWNLYDAVPMIPIHDKHLGTTWIAVLELPAGENKVQMIIDGARGADPHRQGFKTVEGLYRCNLVVSRAPVMPSLERALEGTRIKELPCHCNKELPPLAPPASVPPHEYLERTLTICPPPLPSEITPDPPVIRATAARNEASMGVEVKFFRMEHDRHRQPTVVALKANGPAQQAGITIDDIILSIDGHPITNKQILTRVIHDHNPGDLLPVVIDRAGERSTVQVRLESKTTMPRGFSAKNPADSPPHRRHPQRTTHSFYGLELSDLK